MRCYTIIEMWFAMIRYIIGIIMRCYTIIEMRDAMIGYIIEIILMVVACKARIRMRLAKGVIIVIIISAVV